MSSLRVSTRVAACLLAVSLYHAPSWADPVRYDFALARLGIVGDCRHRRVAAICERCPLGTLCVLP